MWCRLLIVLVVAMLFSNSAPALAGCMNRPILRPYGTIWPEDNVRLEIPIFTPHAPAAVLQPTEVTLVGNQIYIDVFIYSGPLATFDSMVEFVDLGAFSPGSYAYTITQNLAEDPDPWFPKPCEEQTMEGSFCVDDPDCDDESCRCPEISASYLITELRVPNVTLREAWAIAINDSGQVILVAVSSGVSSHYLWEDGVAILFDQHLSPTDIDSAGRVVGTAYLSGGMTEGFIWENGETMYLGHFLDTGPAHTYAYGINDLGQIVGSSPTESGTHAFLWEAGVMTDLGTIGGSYSEAWDVNNLGQVTGRSSTGSEVHAFVWDNGTMTDLGTLGGNFSEGEAINDLGQIVGSSRRENEADGHRPFLWEDGTMTELHVLPPTEFAIGRGINNLGQVVGRQFLYDHESGMRDLRNLIQFESGWTFLLARDINDLGQIVGMGSWTVGSRHPFLMTPINMLACSEDQVDCQPNGSSDACDIEFQLSEDDNHNGIPDECEVDCNNNGTPDSYDISGAASADCNDNGVPDECEPDCNANDVADDCEIDDGNSQDCNTNLVPDECEPDCNANDVADECDIDDGNSQDCNTNLVPDDCEPDIDGDGVIDDCDGCPFDPNKTSPGVCGCGSVAGEEGEADGDGDGTPNCLDTCVGVDDSIFGPCPEETVPALSTWGLCVLTLLFMVAAKVVRVRAFGPS